MIEAATNQHRPAATVATAAAVDDATQAKSVLKGAFAFLLGVVDVINPLQHIPVVSTLYRAATGDEIAPQARLVGAALFGGPIGFAAAMANLAVEETTGRDVGEHVMAATLGTDDPFGRQDSNAQLAGGHADGAPDTTDIAWNGPRQFAAQSAPNSPQTAGEQIVWNGPRQWPPSGSRSAADAPPRLEPPPIGWVTTALTQAEAIEAGEGAEAIMPEVEQWVANAMMQALDKYQALARQRQGDDRPS